MLHKKKEGGREKSIITSINNQIFQRNQRTVFFKDNINMYFIRITRELYRFTEEKTLETLKATDFELRELIVILIDVFE